MGDVADIAGAGIVEKVLCKGCNTKSAAGGVTNGNGSQKTTEKKSLTD